MRKKIYTIHCPIEEIWVIEVEATSSEEALNLLGTGSAYQIHSYAGTTKSKLPEVVKVRNIEIEKYQSFKALKKRV